MKKKVIRIIMLISAVTAIVSMISLARNERKKNIYEEAIQQFEAEVLPEYVNDLRDVGFEDLDISVNYTDYSWDEWTKQIEVTEYHTEEIDCLYTDEYGSEEAKEIVSILKAMRNVRNRYCDRYVYKIQGEEVTIYFNDDYTEFFTVHSEDYMYKIYTINGKHSMSINGNPLYYSGGGSNSADLKNNKTNTNKYQYSTQGTSNKDDLYDDYDVYDYDDPEDFYYDWEEDFDGYEDAEEYWEDAWDEME